MPSPQLDQMSPMSSKMRADDDSIQNILDTLSGALKVKIISGNVTLVAQDIQIGNVEIKDDITGTTANVKAATAIAETDNTVGVKDPSLGLTTDVEATANGSAIAILKRLRTLFSGGLPATLGQKIMTASLAVAIASDQSAVPVSGTVSVTEQATAADGAATLPSLLKVVAGWSGAAIKALKVSAAGELQVGIVGAIPAGANTIGGVNIASAVPAGANRIGKVSIRNAADTADIDPPSSGQFPAALTASGNLKTAILEALPAGANAIGTVAINAALPAGGNNIGSVNVGAAIPAGTNRIGGTYQVSGQIIDENGNVLTVKRAFANVAAATTDASIVAAVTGKKLRVLAVAAQAGATATTLTFNSKPAGAGTATSMTFANGANGGEILPLNQYGWFETNAGEGLSATTGAGSTTGVQVLYVEV